MKNADNLSKVKSNEITGTVVSTDIITNLSPPANRCRTEANIPETDAAVQRIFDAVLLSFCQCEKTNAAAAAETNNIIDTPSRVPTAGITIQKIPLKVRIDKTSNVSRL